MKVIISFAGLADRLETLGSRRPFPLMPLAGSTILGHILDRVQDLRADAHILLTNDNQQKLEAWLQQDLPAGQVQVVTVAQHHSPLIALESCEPFLDDEPVIFVSGNFIVDVDYMGLSTSGADVVCFLQEDQEAIPAAKGLKNDAGQLTSAGVGMQDFWAGVLWIRRGKDLLSAFAHKDQSQMSDIQSLLSVLHQQGLQITNQMADTCLETGSLSQLLLTNARLMQLGYCSEDVIARSYAEEFTVLPPVFLHESAVVNNAVIGPFVNLEADTVVNNCVLRNSLIGVGAEVSDIILDSSFIGDYARVIGQGHALIAGDESNLKLD
ncbi:MAG: hypothetical protein R3293_17315 [Candidatus Promineifilaceae bacterium]|nr:hypothetical protein [Candidatus Promineifilaceae bacterium]